MVEGILSLLDTNRGTESCVWVDCRPTSGIYCLFKDFFGHVRCCTDFVNLVVIYDVPCQGDASAFVRRNV